MSNNNESQTPVRRSSRQPVSSNRFNNGDFICEIRPAAKSAKPKPAATTTTTTTTTPKVKQVVEEVSDNSISVPTPKTEEKTVKVDVEESVRRRNEDAQLLLLLSSTDKKSESKEETVSDSKPSPPVQEAKQTEEKIEQRKQSRRKHEVPSKDVTSELNIVKDPPSIPNRLDDSMTSVGSPFALSVGSPSILNNSIGTESSGKRKRIMSIVAREAAETEAELREAKRRKEEEKLLNKQKSLEKQISVKLAKSEEKKSTSGKSKSKSDSGATSKSSGKKQATKKPQLSEKELKKLKKKKKKEKKRRRLFEEFEKLIETSQINVKMIEKELEERKSQKLLKKMFKMQQKFQREQLAAQQHQQQIFFPPITPFDWFNQPSPLPSPAIRPPQTTLHLPPSAHSTNQATTITTPSMPVRSNEPICCTVPNCNKQFRKPALLAYHLKYHHYLGQENEQPKSPQIKSISGDGGPAAATTTRRDSNKEKIGVVDQEEEDHQISKVASDSEDYSDDENAEDDPYEVIHCSCGKNINTGGFMIQCECCLCWQHGDCEKLSSEQQVPDSYLCWLCSQANNQLRKLKYQSWMQSHKSVLDQHERKLKRKMRRKQADGDSSSAMVDDKQLERDRLNAINECSKIYYEMSLISYTIEYQMSLVHKIVQKGKKALAERSQPNSGQDVSGTGINQTLLTTATSKISSSSTQLTSCIDQAQRLNSNVKHLQRCLADKTAVLNKKLDEFEINYCQRFASLGDSDDQEFVNSIESLIKELRVQPTSHQRRSLIR